MIRNSKKTALGVTLLEIMLVLAVAAMILVMSIRYYTAANSTRMAEATIEQVQSVIATVDSMYQGVGTYANVSTAQVSLAMPATNTGAGAGGGLTTEWNSTIAVTGVSTTTYTITIPSVPVSVCPAVAAKLIGNPKITTSSTCSSSVGSLVFTYNTAL